MRLLLVNPNTTAAVTERMGRLARRAAGAGTEIDTVSAASGLALIETLEQSAVAGDAVVRLLVQRVADFDAAIIAAYSDPGLKQARKQIPKPVVGIAEASMIEAAAGGRRFAIVTIGGVMIEYLRHLAGEAGVREQLAAVRALDAPFAAVASDPAAFVPEFREATRHAIDEGAEAIVIGGGPLAGIAERLAGEFPVPLLDGVACAVWRAQQLAG